MSIVSKKQLRTAVLTELRRLSKVKPDYGPHESLKLCQKLFHDVQRLRESSKKQLLVCVYLPMPFEADLRHLMHSIWNDTQRATSSTMKGDYPSVRFFTPFVLPTFSSAVVETPSTLPAETSSAYPKRECAMAFVEIQSAEDLDHSFSIRGKWKLLELKEEVWAECFQDPSLRDAHQQNRTLNPSISVCDALTSVSTNDGEHRFQPSESPSSRRRGLILCDAWNTLFPCTACNTEKVEVLSPSPTSLPFQPTRAGSSTPLDSQLLVLTPATGFDSCGGRIGKGGGFYDRFLAYQRAWRQHSESSSSDLHVWGVGFDEQLLDQPTAPHTHNDLSSEPIHVPRCERIPVDSHDERMNRIVTPSFTVDTLPSS